MSVECLKGRGLNSLIRRKGRVTMSVECLKGRGLNISDEEVAKIDQYLKVFEEFDNDHNGFLNRDEINNLLDACNLPNKPTPRVSVCWDAME
jgi:hypothetical protein